MNLAGLGGRPDDVAHRLIAAAVTLKRVSNLVRENVDVAAGAVEVGKDKWELELVEEIAEPTARLPLSGFQIHRAACFHLPEEAA